jgi:hypothetical protein
MRKTAGAVVKQMTKFSLERQDEFVYHLLVKHMSSKGTFLDVGCATPVGANNTYSLEKDFGWDGFAFDIGNVEEDENWSKFRDTPFYQVDATSDKFSQLLQDLLGDRVVEYISLDIDMYDTSFSLDGLKRITDAGVTFKSMTLEHESFKHGNKIAAPTRELLRSHGYETLFEDVSFEDGNPWEDWWIKPDLIPIENIMDIKKVGATFNNCIETLIEFTS